MTALFVSVVGQDDNIGDSLLRRVMLESVRNETVQLHVFVGPASDGYIAGLGIHADDVIYRDRKMWISSMRIHRGSTVTSFLANPGEIVRMRGPLHFGRDLLQALYVVHRRGGALVQAGAGIRDLQGRPRLAKLSALRFFDVVTWRDAESMRFAGLGSVSPDWGFASSDCVGGSESLLSASRDVLAVTMRGDRPMPGDDWLHAVKTVARTFELEVVTFAQVRRDASRARELASILGASETVGWTSDNHCEQEHVVRELCRRSLGVVSDRLHALILGATEGAYPLGIPALSSGKLERTLEPAAFEWFFSSASDALNRLSSIERETLTREVALRVTDTCRVLDATTGGLRSALGIT